MYKTLVNKKKAKNEQHPFHLVHSSPWPFLVSCCLFNMMISLVNWFHGRPTMFPFLDNLIMVLFFWCVFSWFRDVIVEGTFEGQHTLKVQRGLRFGMMLFMVSEVMFFVGFFWAFFHSALIPSEVLGGVWPPKGIEPLNPWGLPLLNTVILLSSGVSMTWAHRAILSRDREGSMVGLAVTMGLGILFTLCQLYEYKNATFTMNDGIYGSVFYMATGFHGFHVLVGTLFLLVCLVRHIRYHFTVEHHIGFEAAAWYWHFVDVVWLFLFVSIYWWGY